MNPRLVATKLASHATRWIGCRWGDSFPHYYVSEHPKSGGTWLARMLGEYLGVPVPDHPLLPLTTECVVKNHWRFDPRLRRVLYLYRDGRDVMVSFYYHRFRVSRYGNEPGKDYVHRTYDRLFGREWDPADIVRHLPRFIEFEFADPGRGTPLNWRDHIADWYQPGREGAIAYLSYEQLRRDCAGTLGRAIETITGRTPEPRRLQATVDKLSMKRQTGRRPGESDLSHPTRKGVVGDWRNHFSREAAELFDELAGDTLVRLAYENDRGWIDRYEYQIP